MSKHNRVVITTTHPITMPAERAVSPHGIRPPAAEAQRAEAPPVDAFLMKEKTTVRGKRFFNPDEIFDRRTRAAGEIVASLMGREVVRGADLPFVRKMLRHNDAKLKTLNADKLDILQTELDKLGDHLHPKIDPTPGPGAYFMPLNIIRDDHVRRCAEVIRTNKKLSLDDVREAIKVRQALDTGQTPSNVEMGDKIKKKKNRDVVTAAALQQLSLFMETREGGLTNWGPLYINSATRLSEVHRLPLTPFIVAAPQGKKKAKDGETPGTKIEKGSPLHGAGKKDMYTNAILAAENLLGRSRFDRVYLVGENDGQLYVAINKHGCLEGLVQAGETRVLGFAPAEDASGGRGSSKTQPAHVVHVEHVDKNFGEATFGAAVRAIARFGSIMRNLLTADANKEMAKLAKDISKAVIKGKRKGKTKPQAAGSAAKASLVGVLAGLPMFHAAEAFGHLSWQLGGPIAALAVLGTANLIDMATKSADDRVVYRASGITF
jgi:hypothetical protein